MMIPLCAARPQEVEQRPDRVDPSLLLPRDLPRVDPEDVEDAERERESRDDHHPRFESRRDPPDRRSRDLRVLEEERDDRQRPGSEGQDQGDAPPHLDSRSVTSQCFPPASSAKPATSQPMTISLTQS